MTSSEIRKSDAPSWKKKSNQKSNYAKKKGNMVQFAPKRNILWKAETNNHFKHPQSMNTELTMKQTTANVREGISRPMQICWSTSSLHTERVAEWRERKTKERARDRGIEDGRANHQRRKLGGREREETSTTVLGPKVCIWHHLSLLGM